MIKGRKSAPKAKAIPSPYTIENFLGRGGISEVYQVSENTAAKVTEIVEMYKGNRIDQMVKEVTVNFLLGGLLKISNGHGAHLDEKNLRRYNQAANEAEILKKVRRIEHIVQFQGSRFIDLAGILCYVVDIDYLPGRSLDEVFDEDSKPLHLRDAAKAITDVAQVLPSLSKRGIVHRDIKPANIIYCDGQNIGEGNATLIDLGIAIDGNDSFSRGTIFGTPGYLSPEQARAEKLDSASDVFSLGLTAIRCYTKIQPFMIHHGNESGEELFRVLSPLVGYDVLKRLEIVEKVRHKNVLPENLISAIEIAIHEDPRQRSARPLQRESELLAVGCYGL